MEFLLLWSGDVRGMKKARITGVESKGLIGHARNGKTYLPDPAQLRAALPRRFHRAWDDQSTQWQGLPQIWQDATNNNAPLTIHLLYSSRDKIMVTLYLQPLTDTLEKASVYPTQR